MRHCFSTTTAYLRVFPSTLAPNARRQARRAAGARHERTLAAVACTPWLGWGVPWAVGGDSLSLDPVPMVGPFRTLLYSTPSPYPSLLDHLVCLEEQRWRNR